MLENCTLEPLNKKKQLMLKKHAEFVRVCKFGSRAKTRNIVSVCMKNHSSDSFSIGFTASKKIGNAVVRNFAKRRMRHLVHLLRDEFHTGYCFVFIATAGTVCCDFSILLSDFLYCVRRSMSRTELLRTDD